MKQYLELLKDVYKNSVIYEDRTGVGRSKVFGRQLRFNMGNGFPLVTTRYIPFRFIIEEILWMLRGSSDVTELNRQNIHIWDNWAVTNKDIDDFLDIANFGILLPLLVKHANRKVSDIVNNHKESEYLDIAKSILRPIFQEKYLNSVGPIYGPNWRGINSDGSYDEELDQIQYVINNLLTNPFRSSLCVSSWKPEYIPDQSMRPQFNVLLGKGALPPCHAFFQFLVTEKNGQKYLSLDMYQRSLDLPVGGPYNIAMYSFLLYIVAKIVNMVPNEFIWSTGDTHIYANQLGLIDEQLSRCPLELPRLIIKDSFMDHYIADKFFTKVTADDFELVDYKYYPKINYNINV
jgi:thymidylate synthase